MVPCGQLGRSGRAAQELNLSRGRDFLFANTCSCLQGGPTGIGTTVAPPRGDCLHPNCLACNVFTFSILRCRAFLDPFCICEVARLNVTRKHPGFHRRHQNNSTSTTTTGATIATTTIIITGDTTSTNYSSFEDTHRTILNVQLFSTHIVKSLNIIGIVMNHSNSPNDWLSGDS